MRQIQQKQTNIPFAPLPSASRQFYVDKGGSDSNNGSVTAPFLTIAHAIAAVNALGDASTTKRYDILVGPGDYADTIVLPAWTWIIGGGDVIATRLNGNVSLDPATWSIPGPTFDVRGGFSNVILRGTVTVDFNAANSNFGKVYWNNCWFNNSPTFSSYVGVGASGINQIFIQNCVLFAGYTQNGINLALINSAFINPGTIVINSVNVGHPAILTALGGGANGTPPSVSIHATWTVGAPPAANDIQITLIGFGVGGGVTLDGANISYQATAEGLPLPTSLSLLNGAPAPVSLSPSIDQGGNSFGAPLDIGTNDGQPAQIRSTTSMAFKGGSQSSKISDTHVDTVDGTLTTLATFPLPVGKTLRARLIIQANIIGDGTNPDPAPTTFYRECMVTPTWPGFASSGAVNNASDAGLTFVSPPFVAGAAPFHTPINYSTMLALVGTDLVVQVQGYGGPSPVYTLGSAYGHGVFVSNAGNYYYCLANIANATTPPTTTSANEGDDTGAWAYVTSGAATIRWTLCSYELFVG